MTPMVSAPQTIAGESGRCTGKREEGVPTIGTISESLERFTKSIFKVFFWKFYILDMFWGSFRGVKTYSEQKRFIGQDFKEKAKK